MAVKLNVTEFSSNLSALSLVEVTNSFDIEAIAPVDAVSEIIDPNTRKLRVVSSKDAQIRLTSDQNSDDNQAFFNVLQNTPEVLSVSPFFGDNIRIELREIID